MNSDHVIVQDVDHHNRILSRYPVHKIMFEEWNNVFLSWPAEEDIAAYERCMERGWHKYGVYRVSVEY